MVLSTSSFSILLLYYFYPCFFLFITFFSLPIFLEFIYSVCAGALLIASHTLFYIPVAASNKSDTEITPLGLNVLCNLTIWCAYIGWILVDSALICKIYRMKLITDQPLRRGLMILPKHVIGPYIILMTITVSTLIAWTAVHPDKFVTRESDQNKNKYMGVCSFDNDNNTIDIAFFSAMNGLKTIVVIILLVLAWKIRHVNQELGDSKRIFRLMTYLIIIQFIYAALNQTIVLWEIELSLNISIKILLSIIHSFLTSIGIIGFLIMPRMYYVWYEHNHGQFPENVQMIGDGRTTVRGVNPAGNGNGNSSGNDTDVTLPRSRRNNGNDYVNESDCNTKRIATPEQYDLEARRNQAATQVNQT